ncbi:hypothetical protein [Rhizobium leguminosarum]|uniref:hypothetical protein n=1 Tax=Rhizobium leguminosarum TaxID=384 RepID=UPI0013E2C116|nr:hypothetical protein [Rhizobium leguminosarum]
MEIAFNGCWADHPRIFDHRRRRHGKMRRAQHAVAGKALPSFLPSTRRNVRGILKERKPALVTKERPKELLAERGLKVMFSGMDPAHAANREGCVTKGARELISFGSEAQ